MSAESKSPTKAIRTIAAAKPGADDHSLGQNWAFWHTVPVRKGKDYTGGEVLVHKFQTVEELFVVNDCVKSVSELREADHNYCFFRDGVEPNWDAAVHKDGGRFVVNFRVAGAGVRDSVATVVPKPKRGVKKMIEEIAAAGGVEDVSTISLEEPEMDIDHVWQTISLGVVGGDFDREGLVTGAMIERKRGKKHSSGPEYRVSVWLSQGLTNETAEQIGESIRASLGLPARMLELYRFNKEYFKLNPVVIV